jgi:hypothetical protein
MAACFTARAAFFGAENLFTSAGVTGQVRLAPTALNVADMWRLMSTRKETRG